MSRDKRRKLAQEDKGGGGASTGERESDLRLLCGQLWVPSDDARYDAFLALPWATKQDYILTCARMVETLSQREQWQEPAWAEQLRGRVESLKASLSEVRKNPRDNGRLHEMNVARALDRVCRSWGGDLSGVHVVDTAARVHSGGADLTVQGLFKGEAREVWLELKSNSANTLVGTAALEALLAKVAAAPESGPLAGAVLCAQGAVAKCSSLPEVYWAGSRPIIVLSHLGNESPCPDLLVLVVRFLLVSLRAKTAEAGADSCAGPKKPQQEDRVNSFMQKLRDVSAIIAKQSSSLRLAEKHVQAARKAGEGLLGELQVFLSPIDE